MNVHTMQRMNIRRPPVLSVGIGPIGPIARTERDAANARRLVLADGSIFEGELFGATVAASGEVVFNTALSGYQEILTDPSYAGQIITFTNPHIGNYGVNADRLRGPAAVLPRASSFASCRAGRATAGPRRDLDAMLRRYGIPGITGIDTRRLTRLIRDTGAIPGAFGPADDVDALRAAAAAEPGTDGIDLVATVTTPAPYTVGGDGPFTIVAYDFGIKRTILRHLAGLGTVEVVPATTPRRRRARPRPGRRLPVQRARRPGRGAVRRRGDPASCSAQVPDLRHLPRPPAARPGPRRRDGQAAVRAPRRQPPGQGPHDRASSRSPARTTTSPSTRRPAGRVSS